jgi:hypothetical protein
MLASALCVISFVDRGDTEVCKPISSLALGAEDVSPELLAFPLRPRSGALVYRDDELRDEDKDLEELGVCGFH